MVPEARYVGALPAVEKSTGTLVSAAWAVVPGRTTTAATAANSAARVVLRCRRRPSAKPGRPLRLCVAWVAGMAMLISGRGVVPKPWEVRAVWGSSRTGGGGGWL